MTLQELLDELRNNILRDASDLISGSSDQLWSDATLVRYINEAYQRFCRRTQCLLDRSSVDAAQVPLVEGETVYELHSSVVSVVSAQLDGDTADLAFTGHAQLDGFNRVNEGLSFDLNTVASYPPGKPLAWSVDEGARDIRVFPAPSADYDGVTLNLRVVRQPIEAFSTADMGAVPEIREEWQLGMLDWAAYRALSNHDVDGENLERANRRKKAFEDLVSEVKSETRWLRRPAITWGFGQHGFSWTK